MNTGHLDALQSAGADGRFASIWVPVGHAHQRAFVLCFCDQSAHKVTASSLRWQEARQAWNKLNAKKCRQAAAGMQKLASHGQREDGCVSQYQGQPGSFFYWDVQPSLGLDALEGVGIHFLQGLLANVLAVHRHALPYMAGSAKQRRPRAQLPSYAALQAQQAIEVQAAVRQQADGWLQLARLRRCYRGQAIAQGAPLPQIPHE